MNVFSIFGSKKADKTAITGQGRIAVTEREALLEQTLNEAVSANGELNEEALDQVAGGINWLRCSSPVV